MQEYQATITFADGGWAQYGGVAETREEGLASMLGERHPGRLVDEVTWTWTRPFPQEFTVHVDCTLDGKMDESFRTRGAAMRYVGKVIVSPRVRHIVLYDNYAHTAHTIL